MLEYFCGFRPAGTAKNKWAFHVIEVPYDCFTSARLTQGTTVVNGCLTSQKGLMRLIRSSSCAPRHYVSAVR